MIFKLLTLFLAIFSILSCGKSGGNSDTAAGEMFETADVAAADYEDMTVDAHDSIYADADGGEAFYFEKLSAGVSRRVLPIPLGISTSGYGQSKDKGDPVSPFADTFPATVRIHSLPMIKCLAVAKEHDIAALVTIGLSGMTDFPQLFVNMTGASRTA